MQNENPNDSETFAQSLVSGAHLHPKRGKGRPEQVSDKREELENLSLLERDLASVMNANDRARESLAVVNVQLFDLRRKFRDARAKLLREVNAERVAAAEKI